MVDVPSSTVTALLRLGALPTLEWDEALEEILRIDSGLLDVDRVSYWSFQDEPASIVCELGYVRPTRLFEHGTVLPEEGGDDAYMTEARRVQVLAVRDARSDPRVGGISSYLDLHEVGALLDVPVLRQGEIVGVLCHEHVGGPREWTSRECELALSMCQTLSARLEAHARSRAEEAERHSSFLTRVSNVLADELEPERADELAVQWAIPMLGEIAALIGYDGTRAWPVAQAHADSGAQALLEQFVRQFRTDAEGPGIGVQALREGQSLLLPMTDPGTVRRYGLDERSMEQLGRLGVRSAMSVPVHARGAITGVFWFASTARTYDRDDLRFAEAYARQVGVLLSNVRLYGRMQEALRARDEFLSLASHELRTPLASLALSAEVLARDIPEDAPEACRRAVGTVTRQSKRLSRLSELLLAASRSEDSTVELHVEPVDLAALVREVASEHEDALTRAGCELRLAADGPVPIRGDAEELKVVLSNLLDNASKFGAGRPVEVSVDARDGVARVVVRDRGIGISDGQHDRLFRRFARGVSARHFGGLGLGLHVASRIVDAHGGTLRVAGRPRDGASFSVELPSDPRPTGALRTPA